MRVKLKVIALNNDRYRESDDAVVATPSSVLQDIGLVTKTYASKVDERYKISSEKSRIISDLQNNRIPNNYVVFTLTEEKITP
ncbi:hypothetical protein AVEN_273126-1 [Araneus ventricosus]|uniref:Uncharacterized protein n=1 Tax=Araneus ventricosus TaxID=182803 RepID=A0A4Y2WP56_ARAVE|nr:hypothetical protein AVEN_224344-1 [Araneus ventricosus]GBO37660.1 hypothetical protein AVEN_175016-1 [Araneus ventricosus]GBO37727.1 hypothetical protein AVEN_269179-1 [Araneus ventricosus]GBO37746.1 hypothetical protein AVEN_273126-1 [Araneus ventricosus]